jgi:hypothetical protein
MEDRAEDPHQSTGMTAVEVSPVHLNCSLKMFVSSQVLVAHSCNPSSLESQALQDLSLRPAQAK